MIVVSDTSPINYLTLIGHIDVLPQIFGVVVIPSAVLGELCAPKAPVSVRALVDSRPEWLQSIPLETEPAACLAHLDAGEREAITLALQLKAHQLLIDDYDARAEAMRLSLPVVGTLGVLRLAADVGLIDLPSALAKLQ